MQRTLPPFEVADEHGGRPYLIFYDAAGPVAWPWHALRSVKLSLDETSLLFEYTEHSVEIEGRCLAALFNLAVTTKLKSVRVGDADEVVVSKIRILGES